MGSPRDAGRMHDSHSKLIKLWREAAAATLKSQRDLDEVFESFLAGKGPPPEQKQLDDLRELQQLEYDRLQAALRHVERKAKGQPTEPGALE